MPRNVEDVETCLLRLNRMLDRHDDAFIVSSGVDGPPICIMVSEPIVVVRVDIGPLPEDRDLQNKVCRRLLEHNGADLVHSAYALEGNKIILSSGLPLENLDQNELAAALSDIDLALARQVGALNRLAKGEAEAT